MQKICCFYAGCFALRYTLTMQVTSLSSSVGQRFGEENVSRRETCCLLETDAVIMIDLDFDLLSDHRLLRDGGGRRKILKEG